VVELAGSPARRGIVAQTVSINLTVTSLKVRKGTAQRLFFREGPLPFCGIFNSSLLLQVLRGAAVRALDWPYILDFKEISCQEIGKAGEVHGRKVTCMGCLPPDQ
jgi:hypothetical protein